MGRIGSPHRNQERKVISPALRQWLWEQFGWDIHEWADDDIRF
jgi:hypothetical protein